MTNDAATAGSISTVFDGWRSISIALFMALVGYSVMVSVPVLSTALVAQLGFTEEQVGRVWGADLGGLSLGAIMSAMLVARFNRRLLVLAGVILSLGANALCIVFVEYEQVMWLRVAAGIGSGIFTAVAVVSLGATTNITETINERDLPVFHWFDYCLCIVYSLDTDQASQCRRTGTTGKGRK
jgi:predicted MFS family arabinose efflux permease